MTAATAPAPTAAPEHEPRPRHRIAYRVALHTCWITLLALWLTWRVERYGFNATDQGFVLAQSWRLLNGETPHLNVVSARPLGSAYLHILDFLIPGPVFLVSVLLATLELMIATVAVAALASRRPVTTWGPWTTGLVAASALINVHLYAVMSWHTIDGVTLVASGWWALDAGLRSGSVWTRRLGLAALGAAAICKQSFIPAAVVGLVMVLVHPTVRASAHRWGRVLLDAITLAAVPLLYLVMVSVGGGLGDMVDQLTGGAPTGGGRLLDVSANTGLWRPVVVFTALAVGAAGLTRWRARAGMWVRRGISVGGVGVLAWTIVDGGLLRAGDWGISLWWMLLVTTILDGLVRRYIPWRPAGLLLLGWMASLSWGYDSPTLLGGSLALITAGLLVSWVPWSVMRRPARGIAQPALGLVVVLAASMFLVTRHDADPYRDLPRPDLMAGLGGVSPAMHGIVTNASVFAYTAQIAACVERYPAAAVAVLPENPFIYPALGLRNPFPLDWPLPAELVGDARTRMLATADRLDQTGGYLVLFQTVDSTQLASGQPVPTQPQGPIVDYDGLETQIFQRLHGPAIHCGSFLGVWRAE